MKLFYAGPSIEELHEEYAKKGRLDEDAPVRSASSVTIDAPAAVVWRLVSDMRDWPAWRSDARVTELGAVEPDARFRWKVRGTPIRSTFAVVAPERELTWTGVAMGWMKAVDRIRLAPTADGGTLVTVEESLSGPLLTLFYSSGKLREGHEDLLRMLKAAAEG
ncbi:SRPBCC family protein [Streptacidiphilus sp. ASG 303]|uniref:SRPBCC family protein n=1 Tax=Streptacidiphilus sp. ASG 303 TaxID=2896847 RepID=UPI001E389B6A|nr:SRPBCC family protein [Streptacidiphilus sp. ASG 303]MCD0484748.1 SRPBCC family protein [Streptacidiphilus sp. ASG 303]